MNNSTTDAVEKKTWESIINLLDTDVNFRNFLVSMMAINAVESVLASSLNALILIAFVKLPSLRTPSNILILSLAISDFGEGLVVQPTHFLNLFAIWRKNPSLQEISETISERTCDVLMASSLLTVAVITIDRFLALKLHLRYQELVTAKTSIVVVIIIWIASLSLGLTLAMKTSGYGSVIDIVHLCGFYLIITATIFLMLNISRIVRRHTLQVQALQPTAPSNNMRSCKRSVNTMYYIMLSFTVCYCPMLFACTAIFFIQKDAKMFIVLNLTDLLLMTNSTLNPIIYFWRIQEMRSAVADMLQSVWSYRLRKTN